MARSTFHNQQAHERPLSSLIGNLAHQLSHLVQQEAALARLQARQIVKQLMTDGLLLIIGGVLGLGALLVLCGALAAGLAAALAPALGWIWAIWLGPLIAAIALGLVAGGLMMAGRRKLQQVDFHFQHSRQSLREDARWLKNQFQ